MFLVQVGCVFDDGMFKDVVGVVMVCYVLGVDEVEVVCEIVVIIKQVGLVLIEVMGYGIIDECLVEGYDIFVEECVLMQCVLDENVVIVVQMELFYDEDFDDED